MAAVGGIHWSGSEAIVNLGDVLVIGDRANILRVVDAAVDLFLSLFLVYPYCSQERAQERGLDMDRRIIGLVVVR